MQNDKPKSAIEIAMEKLRQQDEVSGNETVELDSSQVEAIAEARAIYQAQVAECKILQNSAMATTFEPAARQELETNFHRELARFVTDRDKKIDRIRKRQET